MRAEIAFGRQLALGACDISWQVANYAPIDATTWLEFLGPGDESCCGLCGNTGLVDTRGTVKTPKGNDCGIRAFCICPNGRLLKNLLGGELPLGDHQP